MSYSQTKISYIHDLKKEITIHNIEFVQLKKYINVISNGLNNGVFWFKIESFKEEDGDYIIQVLNNQRPNTLAYQNEK
ncbi:hypothetical protein ES045_08000 [Polaribacter sp. IC073]|nr:hypothetical protein ES045_08000 [Polaribacter sp. IC073]